MPRLFLSLRLGRRLAEDLVLHRLGTPRRRSRSRTRSSSLRTSEAPTTGSFDPTAMAPPSSINRRHRNGRFAAPPFRLATAETASPGNRLSPMMRSFSRSGQYRRRATPVITSTRRMSSSGMSMSPSTGLSLPWSCRTVRAKRGAVHAPTSRRAGAVRPGPAALDDSAGGHENAEFAGNDLGEVPLDLKSRQRIGRAPSTSSRLALASRQVCCVRPRFAVEDWRIPASASLIGRVRARPEPWGMRPGMLLANARIPRLQTH